LNPFQKARYHYVLYRVLLRVYMGKARRDRHLKEQNITEASFLPEGDRVCRVDGIKAIPRKGTDDFVLLFAPREKEVMEMLDLKDGETFVDVGANVGGYALKMAQNRSVKVIAIEAHPETYKALCRNIDCNGFANITAINKAAMDKPGTITLYDRYKKGEVLCTCTATIDGSKDSTSNPVVVPSDTLDSMLEGNLPDIVKMDIEGAELAALQGALQTLKRARRVIVEVHDNRVEEVRAILAKSGLSTRGFTSDNMPYLVGEQKEEERAQSQG
jgi:FkbM family methyltransferase